MPNVSPKLVFWLTFAMTIGIGITSGAVHLTHMIPPQWMDTVTAYVSFGVFVTSTFLTLVAGAGMSKQSILASAAAIPEVKSIVTTQATADATPSDKVVGPPTATGEK